MLPKRETSKNHPNRTYTQYYRVIQKGRRSTPTDPMRAPFYSPADAARSLRERKRLGEKDLVVQPYVYVQETSYTLDTYLDAKISDVKRKLKDR